MADGLPAEAGWYRLTEHGWQHVDDTTAEAEIGAGQGWDLMHVNATMADAEIPLF